MAWTNGGLASRGVYGIRLRGLTDGSLLATVAADAPALELSCETGRVHGREEEFGPAGAEIALLDGGWVSLLRSGHAHFILPRRIQDQEILHPWLVPAAATFNGWHGRQVLHGGAFCSGDSAVAVLGAKEDGKSTLLAWLSQTADVEVLADDLIVIDHRQVLAGPRCIDLRHGSAGVIGSAGPRRLVRDADRLRLILPECRPQARLAAIVSLSWGDGPGIQLRRVPGIQGLGAVLPHAANGGLNAHLLDLLDVPVWELVRPRRWDVMSEVRAHLLQLVDADKAGSASAPPLEVQMPGAR